MDRERERSAEAELRALRQAHPDATGADDRATCVPSALLAIRSVSRLIVKEDDPAVLIQGACDRLSGPQAYGRVWVALLDEPGNSVTAWAGAGLERDLTASRSGLGQQTVPPCVRRALDRRDTTVFVTAGDECPECPLAPCSDDSSAMVACLGSGETVYGVIGAVLPTGQGVTEAEERLFTEVAGDLGFALHRIEMLRRMKEIQRDLERAQSMAQVGSWRFDLSKGTVTASKEARGIYGLKGDQWSIPDVQRVPLPEYRAALDEALRALVENGTAYDQEFEIRRPADGAVRHIRSVAEYDPERRTVLGTLQDITEQRETEGALRESEAAYRCLFENANEAILVAQDGRMVFFNQQLEKQFRVSREQVINQPFLSFIHPDDRDLVRQRHEERQRGGNPPERYEFRSLRADGTVCWTEVSSVAFEWEGRPATLNFLTDITERKLAESALRESEEKHRALVEGLPDVVMRFDRQGRHLFVSDNVAEVVPIPPAAFLGKTHRELGFLPELCALWEECIGRVFDSGIPVETEFAVPGSADPMILNWRVVPERDESGNVSSVLSISRDITAHRKAERDYQILFREMLDGFALHEIILDSAGKPADYRFLAVNPAFERMVGLKAEEIVGRTVLEVLPGTEPYWVETFGKVALTGEPVHFENLSGEVDRHFAVSAFRPAPGQFACVFADITDRMRAEEERTRLQDQLSQAQRMESIGRLAGGVAHDFNNMLNVIMGHTEMLLGQLEPSSPLYHSLSEIQEASERSAALTRQLLAFARRQTVAPRQLDLNEAVESMLRMLGRLIGEDIELVWVPTPQPLPVCVDPSQIDQILTNLCLNARDAVGRKAGTITIETAPVEVTEETCMDHSDLAPGSYVTLTVSDDGCGMDRETRANVFEPFFTTKGVGQGVGLGLATVYGIVRQNDGTVTVYSEPGQGTTFRVYLPRHAAARTEVPACPPPATGTDGQATILLVEDEPALLRMTEIILEHLGYTVLAAARPMDAITIAREHSGSIDLLLTDVVMPEMNGRELARSLLSLYPDIHRVFMSGYTANVIAHQGVLDEGVNFIQKPFTTRELAAKLRTSLGR